MAFDIRSRSITRHATASVVSLVAMAITAAEAHEDMTLSEVIVKGQLMRSEHSPFSATILSSEDVRELASPDIDELFRLVPGMAVRDLQLGSVANSIVIRGFGGGGHGGDLGAVIDGVPLNEAMSHADGYVDLNAVIPLEIDAFTVLKGPVSALYGNFNRGGLINIQTRKGGEYAEADFALGSFDTRDLQAAYGAALGGRQHVNLAAHIYSSEGYRPQSSSDRVTLAGRWAFDATENLELALSTRWLESESDSASYLTRDQFETDPRGIDARAQNDGAEKQFLTVRADVNYRVSENMKLLTFAYTTRQDFTRWFSRPVDASAWRQREETYDRSVFGAGTSLNGLASVATTQLKYIAGIETFRESTEFMFFDGLDRRRRLTPALSDRDTKLNSISAFAELEAEFHPLAQVALGVRADRFTGGCERLGPETGSDPCGALNRSTHVSPKLGVRSRLNEWLQLRASWAEGFALPNSFVKYAVGGQPLDETVFRQTEIGAHIDAGRAWSFDLAAYRLTSDGEVRTVSPGIYENYGATARRGVEASALWQPVPQFELHAVYGLADTEVEKNRDARLVGLTVPGVPEHTATVEARVMPRVGWTLSAAWRHVGEYEVDALNSMRASSYDVVDLGLGYIHEALRGVRLYARVDNATDERYATSVSLIGGQALFAPGAPRTYRAGIQFDF